MRNMALATDNAQTSRAVKTVRFRGANNPKLVKVIVSQNARIQRNRAGMEVPPPAATRRPAGGQAAARRGPARRRLEERVDEVRRLGLERALGVIARDQTADRVRETFGSQP